MISRPLFQTHPPPRPAAAPPEPRTPPPEFSLSFAAPAGGSDHGSGSSPDFQLTGIIVRASYPFHLGGYPPATRPGLSFYIAPRPDPAARRRCADVFVTFGSILLCNHFYQPPAFPAVSLPRERLNDEFDFRIHILTSVALSQTRGAERAFLLGVCRELSLIVTSFSLPCCLRRQFPA